MRKQFRKAVLIIMTTLMMMFALAPYGTVLAEEGDEDGPVLFVGGIEVTDDNMYDILDDGGSARFDPDTGTLTLDEPVFKTGLECPILAVDMDLTIEGDASAIGKTFGICVSGGVLTFKDGSVSAKGEKAIACTDLVIDGGSVIAENIPSGSDNYAVYVENTAQVISGALSVTATGDRCRGIVARGGMNVVTGTVTVNVTGKDNCYGIVSGNGDDIFSSHGTFSIQGGEVDITVNASKLNWPSFGSYGITAGDVIQISGGTVSVKSISEYNAYGLYGYADIASGSVTIRTEGEYAYGITANPWLASGMTMSGGKLDVSSKSGEYGSGIDLEGPFTFSGGEIIAKAEGNKTGNTGINLSNEILISGGKITATGTGEVSSGMSCYIYGGNSQVTFEISGGEVNCTATGSGSDGIYSNQTMVISGGTVSSKGSNQGIYCESNLTIGNGIVKVSSEGGTRAIDTSSDYYTVGTITLGNELTIKKPSGGRISDDGKTINESGGKVAKSVEIVNANEYAVKVNETENGSVTSSRTKANGGDKVALSVTPEENCRLTSISVKDSAGKDVPLNDSYEFTMPESDVTVTAVFTRYYAISIPDEAKDFISIEATEYPAGEEVKVTLKDVDDYVIKGIKVTDSEGKEIEVKNNSFVMPASEVTVTAIKVELHTVTFELNGGTLNGDPGPITMVLEEGMVIILEKPEREGYTFKYWEGSVYYAGDEYEVTEDHELGAVWEKIRVPDTGDSDRIFLYIWLTAVSAAGAAAVIFHRRKADRI